MKGSLLAGVVKPLIVRGFDSPEITMLDFKKLKLPEKFPGLI